MQSPKASVVEPARQLTLIFDNARLEGLGAAERDKITSALAQILMKAAGIQQEANGYGSRQITSKTRTSTPATPPTVRATRRL